MSLPKIPRPCRACQVKLANKPRQLCCTCYSQPLIRDQYEPRRTVKTGHIPDRHWPLPTKPTSSRPGTEARIRVYAERAANGQQLYHPEDGI